jgi:hypothetical protein
MRSGEIGRESEDPTRKGGILHQATTSSNIPSTSYSALIAWQPGDDAYSTPFRSLIPRQIDHRFQRISITDSTAIRSVIPRQFDC